MRVIIAGSRGITDYGLVDRAMRESGFSPTVVLSGYAKGVDRLGEDWAELHGADVERHIPHWDRHGKAAGIMRNKEMAKRADALVAVWDGKSRGTYHMILEAQKRKLKVYVFNTNGGNQ